MAEIFDFHAFKKKKAERDRSEKNKEHGDKKPDNDAIANIVSKIAPDRLTGLTRIHLDKIKELTKIKKSLYGINPTTRATAEKHFQNWTADDLVSFINESNILDLKSKPTFFIVAFEKLKNKLLEQIE